MSNFWSCVSTQMTVRSSTGGCAPPQDAALGRIKKEGKGPATGKADLEGLLVGDAVGDEPGRASRQHLASLVVDRRLHAAAGHRPGHLAALVRLQCHEGIDASQALYEWDYARQLLYARALQTGEVDVGARVAQLYGPDFLLERPLLRALRAGDGAVLLIDEVDRADDEFEAFLLEVLSDFQVTIPEIGTVSADAPPTVVITSNRTRELHDALKRRCLYHWIEFPDLEREVAIIRLRAPAASEPLARSVAEAVARLRGLDLVKPPGAAEAIDWAQALSHLGADSAEGQAGRETLGWAVKNREDLRRVEGGPGG